MTSKEYLQKVSRMEELLRFITVQKVLDEKLQSELDRISEEIATFEEDNFPFQADSLVEMIELRMFQGKLKQKDIAQILGTSLSRISEILSGKRGLTIHLAKALYTKLNIDPRLILSE